MKESAGSGAQPEITEISREADTSAEIDTQITEISREADTSGGNENRSARSADNIVEQHRSLEFSSVFSHGNINIRIGRVPQHIRSVNPRAYTPLVVSIGPIHHSSEKVQNLEKLKVVYLDSFRSRNAEGVGPILSNIREWEESIRRCYTESSVYSFSGDEFVQMVMLDAIFILELFIKSFLRDWGSDDPLQANEWMLRFLRLDLVLVENQIPYFVLERLYGFAPRDLSDCYSLRTLAWNFFDGFNDRRLGSGDVKIEYLLTDIIRAFKLSLYPLQLWHTRMFVTLRYSATELHDAGVKFVRSSNLCLLGVEFGNGVLAMPRLEFDDQSEALVRNVIALEQFCYWDEVHLTDYFFFLGSLVKTIDDVNLLSCRGILVSAQCDNKAAFSMVKSLVTDITFSGMFSVFPRICKELNEFYDEPCHRWKARFSVTTLKNQYFNNPWRGAGTIAACVLLLLTLVQTITSVLQVVKT